MIVPPVPEKHALGKVDPGSVKEKKGRLNWGGRGLQEDSKTNL